MAAFRKPYGLFLRWIIDGGFEGEAVDGGVVKESETV